MTVYSPHVVWNICIPFEQCWTNVEDVGPTLLKCYTNVLSLLGFRSRRVKLTINSRRYLIWVRSTTLAKTSDLDNWSIPEYFLFHLKHNCWQSCWLQMNYFLNDMIFLKMSNLIYNGTCIIFNFRVKTISIKCTNTTIPATECVLSHRNVVDAG